MVALNRRNPFFLKWPVISVLVGNAVGFVLGRAVERELPERVRQAIAADHASGEVLVCLAQFGAIAFFGAFYAITPKGFPPGVPFEPVPWALGVYFLFTTLRLYLALSGRLNAWFLKASVVIDIAVLMLTIWSFHLQYQQPATVYLKAPTLLYAFILIALRTIRFEAGYVMLAGISAIVGWLVLVAFAIADSSGMRITHNFAEYMTSNSILVGAEVDKVLSFAAVTTILCIAIVRARRLLVAAATEANAASELSRFFAPEVAVDIRASRSGLRPGDAMTRDAAIMMVDLRGFTKLAARLSPEQTMAHLREYHELMVPEIQRHGGAIDKYLGDGIMATFGAARTSETYAADAFRAMEAILAAAASQSTERLAKGQLPFRIGVALATGPVLFGVTGDESRLEFTVIGSVVNLAAKMEKHCKVVTCSALATRTAHELATSQGFRSSAKSSELCNQSVEGVSGSIDLVGWR